MASFNQAILTSAGIALLAKVQADEDTIEFTSFVTGDGYYGDGEALTGRTALKKQRQSFPINSKEVINDSTVLITCVVTNKDLKAGYYIKEVGIYAKGKNSKSEPVLYSIATAITDQWDYLPAYNNLLPATITMEFYTEVQNAKEVTFQASEMAYASSEALERLSKRVDAMALDTPLIAIDHNLDCYPNPSAFAYQYGAGMGNGPAGGTNLMEIPTKVEYSGKDSLTIYTTKSAAKPDTEKALHKISDREYVITYQDNETDAVYIRLIPEQKETTFTEIARIPHRMGVYPGVFAAVVNYGAGVGGAGNGPAGGTSVKPLPVQVEYPDLNTVSISSALSFNKPALRQINREEYTVTFEDNKSLSIYLRLLPNGGSTQVISGISIPNTSMTAGDNVTVQNMVFSATAPEDKSLIWGKI